MPGPIATIGSMHTCPICGKNPHVGGPVIGPGTPNILINGKPAAVIGDKCVCAGSIDTVVQGNPAITFNGKPVVCVGDMTAHGGVITMGEPNVIISTATPMAPSTMTLHKIPFPEISARDRLANAEAIANQNEIAQQAPVEEVPEDSSDVTLTTTFALDQLQIFANRDPLALFMATYMKIFGPDIPALAYKELYEDAKNKAAILTPVLKVKKEITTGGRQAAFYNDKKDTQEIWVAEQLVRDAVKEDNNELRGEFMTMLVEEYGHFLDYLLRNKYAETERPDAIHDEGAKFAYKMYVINPIEQAGQMFAEATIDGEGPITITWDFSEQHESLKEYVNKERQNQDDNIGNLEFYKAGLLQAHGQYGHANVEVEALTDILNIHLYNNSIEVQKILDTIYLGNWLRDFSQMVDPMIVRPMAESGEKLASLSVKEATARKYVTQAEVDAINEKIKKDKLAKEATAKKYVKQSESDSINKKDKIEDKVPIVVPTGFNFLELIPSCKVREFEPVMYSVEALTSIVEMAATKEFVHAKMEEEVRVANENNEEDPRKHINKKDIENYAGHLQTLRDKYIAITKDNLGVYRPEEHIDNPKGVGQKINAETLKPENRGDKQVYDKFVGWIEDSNELNKLNKDFGMKNYIRSSEEKKYTVEGANYNTSHQYIIEQLKKAAQAKGKGFTDNKALIEFGAAMHTLEDYFAHTNYAEVSLIKSVESLVFPWVDGIKEKDFTNGTGHNFVYNYKDIYNQDFKYNTNHQVLKDLNVRIKSLKDKEANDLASYIPIVTGTFGLIDTAASILPILNDSFFNIKFTPWEKAEENQRNFADILILELLRDIDAASNNKPDENKNSVLEALGYFGISSLEINSYTEAFQATLRIRDKIARGLDLLIPDEIEKAFHWLFERIGQLLNFSQYFTLKAIASILGDAQVIFGKDLTYLESINNFDEGLFIIGMDPSHTQVAKDDTSHPLHELSALMAVEAVRQVGDKMFQLWNNSGGVTFKDITDVVDKIMRHPVESDWQEKIVREWAVNPENRQKLCDSCSPSVIIDRMFHALEEIDESIKYIKENLGKVSLSVEKAANFLEYKTEIGVDGKKFMDAIDNAILKSQEQLNRALVLKEKWDRKYPKSPYCHEEVIIYKIMEGDTLSTIATTHGTTVEEIKRLNNMTSDVIYADRYIKVPRTKGNGISIPPQKIFKG